MNLFYPLISEIRMAKTSHPGPKILKIIFMLNLAEHEILNACKYKNVQKFTLFSGSYKPRMLFFLLINVKMPKTVFGILNINVYEQEKFHYQLR